MNRRDIFASASEGQADDRLLRLRFAIIIVAG